MKTKYLISFIIISFIIIGSVILVDKIFAQKSPGAANVQYPVEKLGNCKNETTCKSYCDKPENMNVCIDFAEKNNLMSEEEIGMAKKFMAVGAKGPGDCRGKDECETYCNNTSHINECITFAEKNNLIPPEELKEAKKVQAAIARGAKPPPCGNKKACDVYCDNPDHMEECINFGIEAGFIQGKELEDVQKMLSAVKRGIKPPPCRGKETCDKYCGDPNNMEVCMTFAIEAGFMSKTEKADSQKMLAAIKKGVKPPNCRGKEECDIYCSEEEHFEECANFAEAAGFMSPEEAAMARKTKGKGPGDCRGKKECEIFCNNPNNQEVCFNFGKEHGLIPEEDLKRIEKDKQQFKAGMTKMPPEVADCFKSLVGKEMFEKFKSGAAMPPREIGDQMRTCFEKIGPPGPGDRGRPGAGGIMSPAEQAGPGDCKNPKECKTYCESHPDECKNFGSGGKQQFAPGTGPSIPGKQEIPGSFVAPDRQPGGFPPIGPGGCKTPEECQQIPNQIIFPNGQQPPAGVFPPQTQIPPEFQQPPINQQPPTNIVVPPPGEAPPPPSSFLNPGSLLGMIIHIFTRSFHP